MNPLKAVAWATTVLGSSILLTGPALAQIGTRFPSEKKIVIDAVTGLPLTFLTSTPSGDSKIYQTHRQWTADGQWVVFRSERVPGQAMAVHEETGVIVQVTEAGHSGMLCLAERSMHLYYMRTEPRRSKEAEVPKPSRKPRSQAKVSRTSQAPNFHQHFQDSRMHGVKSSCPPVGVHVRNRCTSRGVGGHCWS